MTELLTREEWSEMDCQEEPGEALVVPLDARLSETDRRLENDGLAQIRARWGHISLNRSVMFKTVTAPVHGRAAYFFPLEADTPMYLVAFEDESATVRRAA